MMIVAFSFCTSQHQNHKLQPGHNTRLLQEERCIDDGNTQAVTAGAPFLFCHLPPPE